MTVVAIQIAAYTPYSAKKSLENVVLYKYSIMPLPSPLGKLTLERIHLDIPLKNVIFGAVPNCLIWTRRKKGWNVGSSGVLDKAKSTDSMMGWRLQLSFGFPSGPRPIITPETFWKIPRNVWQSADLDAARCLP